MDKELDSLGEKDATADAFFSQPPLPVEAPQVDWEPPVPPMSLGSKRARNATFLILGASCLSLVGFTAYANLVMVAPAELGAAPAAAPAPIQMLAAAPATESSEQLAPLVPGLQVNEQTAPVLTPVEPAAPAVVAVEPTAPAVAAVEPTAPAVAGVEPVAPPVTAVEPPVPTVAAIATVAPVRVAKAKPRPRPAKTVKRSSVSRSRKAMSPVDSLIKRAHRELKRGDAGKARQHALRAVSMEPAHAGGYIVLAAARDALGDKQGARSAYAICARRASGRHVATCKLLAR